MIHIYFSSLNKIHLRKAGSLIHRKVYLCTGIATAAWVSVASSALHKEVTVLVCTKFPVIFQFNSVSVCVKVALNLCEEVDPLLSIEVAVSKERSAGAGEAHHWQGHRDRHVHLGGNRASFYVSPRTHSPQSVQRLFRCRIFLQWLRCW